VDVLIPGQHVSFLPRFAVIEDIVADALISIIRDEKGLRP